MDAKTDEACEDLGQRPDWLYSETVKEHFLNPRNVLWTGEEEFEADGRGVAGNVVCGDQMLMMIKVKLDAAEPENLDAARISDIAWKTYGCASAIAATSMLSEVAKGLTLAEAADITPEVIAEKLGGLPARKFHCSVLGDKALKLAIEDYKGKRSKNEG